jgi:hypothetical protein
MPKLTDEAHAGARHELCFELPPDIYEQLEKDAAERGVSVKELVKRTLVAGGLYPTSVDVE